ncbi:MAG: flagellar hook-length control protein FliK [Magnetococcales bacterium]|nr:flagellar hook-length control protein FliK [Magnetococcales bacterium]
MIISGRLPPAAGEIGPTASDQATLPRMAPGDQLVGRISQLKDNGQGVFRFADGRGFTFSGGQGLHEGDHVRLEVVRLVPEVALRVAGSDSQAAAETANSLQQSLTRAPDLFARLVSFLNVGSGTVLSGKGDALFLGLQATRSGLATLDGQTLGAVLAKNLPGLSAEALMRGDLSGLVRLLSGGSRAEVAGAVQALREAAATLKARIPGEGTAAELAAARNALGRLGDLLAMQDLLPQTVPSANGEMFLGYRVFWLNEGGLGEAIWRREGRQNGRGSQGEEATSVLLSLNLTRLGAVQARLALSGGLLAVQLAAEDDGVLAALRGRVGELRQALQQAELPLYTLDLSRLDGAIMRATREQALGLTTAFSTQA